MLTNALSIKRGLGANRKRAMTANKKFSAQQLAHIIEGMNAQNKAFNQSLKLLGEIPIEAGSLIKPYIEAQKQILKLVQPAAELERLLLAFAGSVTQVQSQITANMSSFVSSTLEFQHKFESLVGPAIRDFAEVIRRLPERMRHALITLGQHGWYLDLDMPLPDIWELEKILLEGKHEKAEQALVFYFTNRLASIEETLCERFPHRRNILASAFKAHSTGEYNLSVPVFLAQADGICQEMIGTKLYSKREIPARAKTIEALGSSSYRAAFLYPLAMSMPISASEHERDETFAALNRHQVLHGESVDYGTEANSLRAISLLNYVAQVLGQDAQETSSST
jgi:hypothetical protein